MSIVRKELSFCCFIPNAVQGVFVPFPFLCLGKTVKSDHYLFIFLSLFVLVSSLPRDYVIFIIRMQCYFLSQLDRPYNFSDK